MKTLFLITARGGSKGLPDKNIKEIEGIPLVGFKAISARKSKYCSRLVISTDSPKIQEIAASFGVEVPFTRPAQLASDTATSADVVLHAMEWIATEGKEQYEAVMLLEPSSPFTRPFDYDKAIEMMLEHNANLVVGMREVPINSVYVGKLDERGRITQIIDQLQERPANQRQDTVQEYTMNGCLYLFKWDFFKERKAFYQDRDNSFGYVMDRHYSIEIDEPEDLDMCRFLASNGYVDMSYWQYGEYV